MAPKYFAPVWKHFERKEPTGKSKHHRAGCIYCKYELSGQPERMKAHLRKCPKISESVKKHFYSEDNENEGIEIIDSGNGGIMNGNLRIRKKEIGRGYGSGSGTGVAGGEDEGEEDEEEEEGEEGGDVQQEKTRNVDGGSGGRYTSNDTDSDMDDSNQNKGLRGDVLGQGSRRASESIDQEKRTENEIELEKVYEYLKSGVSVGGKVDQSSSANKENANEAEKNDMQITAGNWGKNINTEKYNIVAGYEYRNEDSVSESSKEERVGQKRKASKVLPGEAGIWKMRMNMYTSGKEERMRAGKGRGEYEEARIGYFIDGDNRQRKGLYIPNITDPRHYSKKRPGYQNVASYYSKVKPERSKLTSISTIVSPHPIIKEAISKVPEPILNNYVGCGFPIPLGIEGLKVLDLGCGSGRDCYVVSKLVGSLGEVCGIDNDAEQIGIASEYIDMYSKELGYKPNLKFKHGYIEFLTRAGIFPESIDLCISNNAVNLSPDKELVFKSVFEILREGGEFYFSDIYADRRLPPHLRTHPTLVSENLGGALYIQDFMKLIESVGFADPRQVGPKVPVQIQTTELSDLVRSTKFFAITYRLFKFSKPGNVLERSREDYGQLAIYKGTIDGQRSFYRLDNDYSFEANRPTLVDGNSAVMLAESWLQKHFEVRGDRAHHFGAFRNQNAYLASVDANRPAKHDWETENENYRNINSLLPSAKPSTFFNSFHTFHNFNESNSGGGGIGVGNNPDLFLFSDLPPLFDASNLYSLAPINYSAINSTSTPNLASNSTTNINLTTNTNANTNTNVNTNANTNTIPNTNSNSNTNSNPNTNNISVPSSNYSQNIPPTNPIASAAAIPGRNFVETSSHTDLFGLNTSHPTNSSYSNPTPLFTTKNTTVADQFYHQSINNKQLNVSTNSAATPASTSLHLLGSYLDSSTSVTNRTNSANATNTATITAATTATFTVGSAKTTPLTSHLPLVNPTSTSISSTHNLSHNTATTSFNNTHTNVINNTDMFDLSQKPKVHTTSSTPIIASATTIINDPKSLGNMNNLGNNTSAFPARSTFEHYKKKYPLFSIKTSKLDTSK